MCVCVRRVAESGNLVVMGMLGKVMAISGGVFIGGGLGLYLRENQLYRRNKKQANKLEQELAELTHIRKEKERLLQQLDKNTISK